MLLLLVSAVTCAAPGAAEEGIGTAPPPAAVKPAPNPAPKPAPKPSAAAKPASVPSTAKPGKSKPKATIRTEAEISGLTSETSDQLYGRINFTRLFGIRQWWVRAGYGITRTRTYNKKNVNETELGTFTLDAQYRRDHGSSYRFISAAANIRNRSPHSSVYDDRSGYYMLSSGYGQRLMPGLDGEFALAKITRYETAADERITPVYSLRLKTPLSSAMVLDGDSHFVQPFSDDPLVDSRINLTYKLTSAVSMRLTYVANNMLRPVVTKTGWDKSFRVSLVFSSSGG